MQKLGQVKSEYSYEENLNHFEFEFPSQMNLHAMTWLYPASQVVAKVRSFQLENKAAYKHELDQTIPSQISAFRDVDFKYLEGYLCDRAQAYLQTRSRPNYIGSRDRYRLPPFVRALPQF